MSEHQGQGREFSLPPEVGGPIEKALWWRGSEQNLWRRVRSGSSAGQGTPPSRPKLQSILSITVPVSRYLPSCRLPTHDVHQLFSYRGSSKNTYIPRAHSCQRQTAPITVILSIVRLRGGTAQGLIRVLGQRATVSRHNGTKLIQQVSRGVLATTSC